MADDRTGAHDRLKVLIGAVLEGSLSEAEGLELREVLENDAEARRLYVRHCRFDAMLSEEDEILGLLEAADDSDNVVAMPTGAAVAARLDGLGRNDADSSAAAVPEPTRTRRRGGLRELRAVGAFGAGCLAAGVVAALFVDRIAPDAPPPPSWKGASVRAQSNLLVREAELADGSKVQLAPKSSVALHFTDGERAVDLEDGEAHFAVAHDPVRPFVVAAGAVRVRAVGTAFNVRRAAGRVVVTVTEGRARVGRAVESTKANDAVVVSAGSQVVWDLDAPRPRPVVAAADPLRVLSWRQGRLEYTHEPLRSVVADLNRYSEQPVVLADRGLGSLRVTGVVLTDSLVGWLALLPETLPVRVEHESGRTLIAWDELASLTREGMETQ